MKYAIDRYAVGTETEVNAVDFESKYIPGRLNRFFCPECGETVYFRDKGGTHPSQFYHQEKTDRTPECDKRVDGRSDLSLSQRVGLPIYLTGIISNQYHLNIGFPALGSEILEKAVKAGYQVEISDDIHRRIVPVDSTNFIDDETTLISIDFIPPYGRNFRITTSGNGYVYGLQRKWSDYADGFDVGGAIFSYTETGGKKIRRGDSITTNRSYYAIVRNTIRQCPEIIQSEIGQLHIGNESFRILRIEIKVSIDDKNTFSSISAYFKQYFGVWLLECQPELIPIWPPVVQADSVIPVEPNEPLVCVVSSGNNTPNVYVYSDYGVHKKDIHHDENKINTVEVTTGKRPILLSVDRKYVGREVTIQSRNLPAHENEYIYSFISKSGESVSWQDVNTEMITDDFTFCTNAKMDLYIGTADRIYKCISIREPSSFVPSDKNITELCLVVESAIERFIRFEKKSQLSERSISFSMLLQAADKGALVPAPRWVDTLLRHLKKNHEEQVFALVVSTIKNGKIHSELLRKLRLIDMERMRLEQEDHR